MLCGANRIGSWQLVKFQFHDHFHRHPSPSLRCIIASSCIIARRSQKRFQDEDTASGYELKGCAGRGPSALRLFPPLLIIQCLTHSSSQASSLSIPCSSLSLLYYFFHDGVPSVPDVPTVSHIVSRRAVPLGSGSSTHPSPGR